MGPIPQIPRKPHLLQIRLLSLGGKGLAVIRRPIGRDTTYSPFLYSSGLSLDFPVSDGKGLDVIRHLGADSGDPVAEAPSI